MSDQEMQFADPDWKPTRPLQKQAGTQGSPVYTPQPVNDDFRKDAQQVEETPLEEGYNGLRPFAGAASQTPRQPPRQAPYQYQRMPKRRRRRGAWFWIIIAILFFSLMGGGWSALGSIGQRSVTVDQQFNVSGTPTIVINDTAGNIHVQQGSSLDIQAVKQTTLFDDPNNIKVTFSPLTNNTVTVTIDPGSSFLSSRSVDFNVTVPQGANLDLQTTSGNISASNNTLTNAQLSTTSGDIDASGDIFSGQANITTSSGDVSMEGDILNGQANVNTSSGNIRFDGSIASLGLYKFGSDSGDISIRLSSDANYQAQATTNSGSIDGNGFSSINDNQGSGAQANGSVGTPPGASLNINTNSGDITLQQNS